MKVGERRREERGRRGEKKRERERGREKDWGEILVGCSANMDEGYL